MGDDVLPRRKSSVLVRGKVTFLKEINILMKRSSSPYRGLIFCVGGVDYVEKFTRIKQKYPDRKIIKILREQINILEEYIMTQLTNIRDEVTKRTMETIRVYDAIVENDLPLQMADIMAETQLSEKEINRALSILETLKIVGNLSSPEKPAIYGIAARYEQDY
ncbi:MAG: hypothetical protein F6K40_39005 [Okeania sp. SIO3I5]|uniref:hypothetical protein n=1 Tax=Okeania sp. SIO3I5 TaxID=2607805 RepID=UPI0013BE33E7|nr:hypothetical protein [Okeania sp. SIO3I5]NEQ41852.1 hypothetical protein [Okeania sp. SIO3I5]